LGIEFEIYESSDRVGGRIDTWYATIYNSKDKDAAALYGEMGGMRVPQFSKDMLPVQQLSIALNTVLERNNLADKMVKWRKFYYNSDVQRLRYNNMEKPIEAVDAPVNSLNFGKNEGGDLDMVWVTEKIDKDGKPYLPVNMILEQVNDPFIKQITDDFEKGFAALMKFDNYSMWAYLTNVFTLGDLGDYYDTAMGKETDHLPYNVASYLETLNVGTGMYSVSFVEMIIAVYDWSGSKNSYDKDDDAVYMVTIERPHPKNGTTTFKKRFPYVISTLPNGAYLSGQLKTNFFDNLSFSKARAIRECNYMPSFKAFITFNDKSWAERVERQDKGLGVGTTDRANRQIVYPSYGYEANGGVLQIYCWAQDAERMGALDDEARVNECLKGIQYLYPEIDIYESFAGYKPEQNTKTWFWDSHAGGGRSRNSHPVSLKAFIQPCSLLSLMVA
jgi:monoamine oxidase